jgi:branched-subunit amino acid ABC-type transport system permease component
VELFLTVCVTSLTLGLLYATFALGLGLVLRASGEVNLAHGDSLVLATYVGVATAAAGSPLLAVLLAVVVSAGIGAVSFLAVYGPVQRRTRPGAVSLGFLPALAVALIVRNVSEQLLPRGSRPVPALFPGGTSRIFYDYQLPGTGWWVLALGLLVPLGLSQALTRTRAGNRLRAVSEDAVLARLVGVPVTRTLVTSYLVAGALGGLAGALFASFFGQLTVTLGWQATVKGFVVAVLGGVAWVRGAVLGGIALGVLESFTSAYVTTTYRDVITFGVLITVLLIAPRGLLARETLRES